MDLNTIIVILLSNIGGAIALVIDFLRSRKTEERDKEKDELVRGQIALTARQYDAIDAQPDETEMQRWTRTLINKRLAATRDMFRQELKDEVDALRAIIGTSVTASQYVTTQGNVLEIITRAEQAVVNGNLMIAEEERIKFAAEHALSEIQSVIRAISNFEQQRLNPDEIERRILTAIGESLLHMAKTPVPPVFPMRDYGITTRDTEEEQING